MRSRQCSTTPPPPPTNYSDFYLLYVWNSTNKSVAVEMVKAARNHRISSSYLPAIYCRITLFDTLDNYFNIYATKESTWGSLIKCTFVVHPKRMCPDTYEEVNFFLKRAFPRLFKLHIRVQHRQIIKEMYIL